MASVGLFEVEADTNPDSEAAHGGFRNSGYLLGS